jgi:hypothetical protein
MRNQLVLFIIPHSLFRIYIRRARPKAVVFSKEPDSTFKTNRAVADESGVASADGRFANYGDFSRTHHAHQRFVSLTVAAAIYRRAKRGFS